MIYYECQKCKKEFLVNRDFCPSCFSGDIKEKQFDHGTVVHSVKLSATPENFPEQYYVILGKFSNFNFFCRSPDFLETGTEVSIKEEDGKPVCYPST